jgi:L-2,4-diaminobutyric acid acetyltransferase
MGSMTIQIADTAITLRQPCLEDGAAMCRLVQATTPLDPNSCYAYLLLCTHFADTCVVAEDDDELVGFVSAYRPPTDPDVLFVWQVAVKSTARGNGLAKTMIQTLLERDTCQDVTFLEATVTPSNVASQALFRSLAKAHQARCIETSWFLPEAFGSGEHETEVLFRIGPLRGR